MKSKNTVKLWFGLRSILGWVWWSSFLCNASYPWLVWAQTEMCFLLWKSDAEFFKSLRQPENRTNVNLNEIKKEEPKWHSDTKSKVRNKVQVRKWWFSFSVNNGGFLFVCKYECISGDSHPCCAELQDCGLSGWGCVPFWPGQHLQIPITRMVMRSMHREKQDDDEQVGASNEVVGVVGWWESKGCWETSLNYFFQVCKFILNVGFRTRCVFVYFHTT